MVDLSSMLLNIWLDYMASLLYHRQTFSILLNVDKAVEVAKMVRSRNSAPKIRWKRQRFAGLVLVCASSVFMVACSSVLSEMPTQVGGLPAGTPQRPVVAPEYPAVHDMPPPRTAAVLTEEEKKKVEAELAAMRAEQERRAKAKGLPE
jgi:hypothetical protein